MSSIETTQARAARRQAAAEWDDHREGCEPCRLSRRSRNVRPCRAGWRLILAFRSADAEVARCNEADREPAAGLVPLFAAEEVR